MTEETTATLSRRKMISMGVVGGAAALLGAKPAQAATTPPPGTFTMTPKYVCVTDFCDGFGNPALPNINTKAQAVTNQAAFCKAFASYYSDYAQLPSPIEVYVPAGDWFLWDGFTVPLGCTLRGAGSGATTLLIPNVAFGDGNDYNHQPHPVITLGVTMDSGGGPIYPGNGAGQYTSVGTGEAHGLLPPTVVDGVFLYSGLGVGIDVETSGWVIQNVWCITAIGIYARHDGIISNVIVDGGSSTGVQFDGGQDILVNNLYIYNCLTGIAFSNSNDSIRFSNVQLCFLRYVPVAFEPNSISSNICFDGLSLIENVDYGTYQNAGIDLQGTLTHLTVNNGLFSNLPGWAISNGNLGDQTRIILNNCTFDGTPSNAGYGSNQANAGGILAPNVSLLELNACRFLNLGQPILALGCNYGANGCQIIWNGGVIQNCISTPVELYDEGLPLWLSMSNVISLDTVPIANYVAPSGGDGGLVTGRFENCNCTNPTKDVIWNVNGGPAYIPVNYLTRVATS